MRKNKIDLTNVKFGTYAKIAKECGCSAALVSMVARGIRHNAIIEKKLLQAVRKKHAEDESRNRIARILNNELNEL